MSKTDISSPRLTINESFFRQLWPLILDENICDTRSKHTSPFFVPKKQFDSLWAHGFLASKDIGEYETPIRFYYPPCVLHTETSSEELVPSRRSIELESEEEICDLEDTNRILPIDEQIALLQKKDEHRKKLADNFKNRTIPWYMPASREEYDITDDLETVFTKPLERQLLCAIHLFECKFIIINLGQCFRLPLIEDWLKFCKYVKIILLVRKEDLAQELTRLSPELYPLIFEDNFENTWQEELTRALNTGVAHAKNLDIMLHCAMAFVYIFSSRSDVDYLDKFKVLRKT